MSDQNSVPPTPPTPPTPPPAPGVPAAPAASPYVAPPAAAKQTLALTSFILGLAGFLFAWIPFVGFIGFLAGVAAVILGFLAKAKEKGAPKWMWIVGIIAGFVAIAISIVYLIGIIAIAIIAGTTGDLSTYNY